jgi:hypothetical protein
MAKLQFLYRIKKYDGEGNLNYDSDVSHGDSFIINFMKHLNCAFEEANKSMTDTGNTSRTVKYPGSGTGGTTRGMMAAHAPDDDDVYGIVVGSDDTAVTGSEYKLGTKINDGMGTDELEYADHARETTAVVGSNVDFQFKRIFNNNSGATVAVKEIGINVRSYDTGIGVRTFCIAREVITTVNVADMETLEVIIIMRTTA